MRRASLVWLSLALLVLLAGMAVLQYRWLGQVSAAERQRMQTSLQERVSQFAAEFDRDVARAFFWLQVDAEALRAHDWGGYAERYDRWVATAAHSRMVRDIWVFTAEGASLRFDPAARRFEPVDADASLEPLREEARTNSGEPASSPPIFRWARAVRDDVPAIVVPVAQVFMLNAVTRDQTVRFEHRHSLAHRGVTVIRLDEDYITTSMLPSLAERYFAGGGGIEYQLRITSKEGDREVFTYGPPIAGTHGAPDAAGELFDVRLDAVADLTAAARPPASSDPSEVPLGTGRLVRTTPPEGGSSRVAFDRRIAVSVLQQNRSAGGPERLQAAGARWQLTLRHRAGSLDAAVAAARRRNLVLSGGVLALLASSLIMLVISTQRASRLAAQQMEFVAAVSHELRTPLAVIRSAGENLADGIVAAPDQVKQYGELVRREGRRLTMMVEQVLAFAGMRAGEGLRRKAEPVGELVDRALQGTGAELEAAGLTVNVAIPARLPAVFVDADAIVRALANLLGNAAKYAAQGRAVSITAVAAPAGHRGEVQITVADRGPGISAEDLPHVFEPFFRAPAVVATQVHGTGLGLSLVAAIAKAHGGRASVRSTAGDGAAFTLHLPRATAAERAPAGSPVVASRS